MGREDSRDGLGASFGPGSRASTEPLSTQGLGPSGFDPSRVFAEMDHYLNAAQADGLRPKFFRVAESLLRDLSPGTARLAEYRGVPIREADEWSWGWMLLVSAGTFGTLLSWYQPRDSDGSGEAGETREAGLDPEGDSAGPKGIAQ